MNPPRILFVCVENSCRSQMAEALARLEFGDSVQVYSAGSRASGQVNPKAIALMAELGYDLSRHKSKGLEDIPQVEYDVVVGMGCGDTCPWVRSRRREDWAIPDPKQMSLEQMREVRGLIADNIRILLKDYQATNTGGPA